MSKYYMLKTLVYLAALMVMMPFQCSADDVTTVHLIAHSHDDVGWKQTLGAYYAGHVHFILSSVFESLLKNKDRKFTYVEMKFFSMWWSKETEERKEKFKQLILNG